MSEPVYDQQDADNLHLAEENRLLRADLAALREALAAKDAEIAEKDRENAAMFQRYDIAAAKRDHAEELLQEARDEVAALREAQERLAVKWRAEANGEPSVHHPEYDEGQCDALEACAKELEAALTHPARTLKPNRFDCAECGEGIAVDEDGCCRMCGHDAAIIVNGQRLPAPTDGQ